MELRSASWWLSSRCGRCARLPLAPSWRRRGRAGAITVAAHARIGGFRLPVHYRQVNERWLDQFRPWVYGAGFGWQIGAGLATYIKTSPST